jgi:hypothetical protein
MSFIVTCPLSASCTPLVRANTSDKGAYCVYWYIRVWVERLLGVAAQDRLQTRGISQAEYTEAVSVLMVNLHMHQHALGRRLGRAHNGKRLWEHPLEPRVRVQIDGRHEACGPCQLQDTLSEQRHKHDCEGCV